MQGRTIAKRKCTDSRVRFAYVQISRSIVRGQNIVRRVGVQRRDVLPRSNRTSRNVERKCIHSAHAKCDKELLIIGTQVDFRGISRIERRRLRDRAKCAACGVDLKFLHTTRRRRCNE